MSEPIPEIELTVAFRGYDRHQVQSLIERISSGAVTAVEARAELARIDMVLRGYKKSEVTQAVDRLLGDR
ncbi:anthranilate phosphoribosyltransferase [Lipingzhangella halophila]|uniref:Anthranilate phosphoribosyltransferase n=1 Tax=Lipingzhangella halophila TaxID=1783352 RepID=A0A7W7W551_9ACTN|nr:hypothetical protein [Lipingzhangella halophila]MBB4933509.1 anthranilate phosphoribosyltransferase [Lipingzhangella halophila]